LPPLLARAATSGAADRREANLAIFRDQLAELERERARRLAGRSRFRRRHEANCSVACSTKCNRN
jgi:cytochrome c-type biogenesis protein CcmH